MVQTGAFYFVYLINLVHLNHTDFIWVFFCSFPTTNKLQDMDCLLGF